MHLHAIEPTRPRGQRRVDGVNSTPSSRRIYRYSIASMAGAQNLISTQIVTVPHHGCPLSEGGPPMPTSLDIVEARWAKSRAPDASVAPGAATGLALLIRSGLFSSPFNLKASKHQSCTPEDILNTLHRCIE